MMSYKRDYTALEGDAKRAAALEDVVAYVGWEKFVEVSMTFVKAKANEQTMRFNLAFFVGIEGYPVRAWYELLFGPYEKVDIGSGEPTPDADGEVGCEVAGK
jgi:hypothetical protein